MSNDCNIALITQSVIKFLAVKFLLRARQIWVCVGRWFLRAREVIWL